MIDNFRDNLVPGITVGLIGVGAFGSLLREEALKAGCKVLLCDPPRSFDEADELSETFFGLWGNGMGGCQVTGENLTTFVPLRSLAVSDVIAIQVPLTDEAPWPTRGLITRAFLDACKPTTVIFSFSAPEIFAQDAANDERIVK